MKLILIVLALIPTVSVSARAEEPSKAEKAMVESFRKAIAGADHKALKKFLSKPVSLTEIYVTMAEGQMCMEYSRQTTIKDLATDKSNLREISASWEENRKTHEDSEEDERYRWNVSKSGSKIVASATYQGDCMHRTEVTFDSKLRIVTGITKDYDGDLPDPKSKGFKFQQKYAGSLL